MAKPINLDDLALFRKFSASHYSNFASSKDLHICKGGKMPKNIKHRSNAIASMIRGKSTEIGIRHALKGDLSKTTIKSAQNKAIEHFLEHSKHLNANTARKFRKQISPLVRAGVKTFYQLGAKGYKASNEKRFKINDQEAHAYPDFQLSSITLDGTEIKNPTIELKTCESISNKKILNAGHQSLKYKNKKGDNCLVLFLSAKKTRQRYKPYEIKSQLFRVSENKGYDSVVFLKKELTKTKRHATNNI